MRYIGRNEWLVYGFLVLIVVAASLPLYPYRWHTFLHISGAVVFLGNIVVTAAWMLMAERTRSVNVIHFSAKAVMRADLLFTLPGVLLILMNGLAMVLDRWGGFAAFHELSLDKRSPRVVHRLRCHLGWPAHPRSTPHGRLLGPLRFPGLVALGVLLGAPQVVRLGSGCG